VHIRQTIIAPGVAIGQLFVIDAEEVQDGGLEVVNMNGGADDAVAEVVAGAIVIGSVQPSGFAELPQAPRHPMVNTLNVIVVDWLSGLQTHR
jgi:hypothetical protein